MVSRCSTFCGVHIDVLHLQRLFFIVKASSLYEITCDTRSGFCCCQCFFLKAWEDFLRSCKHLYVIEVFLGPVKCEHIVTCVLLDKAYLCCFTLVMSVSAIELCPVLS